MFKSAETLRLAAEMRALQKVASPWREARTTWFDGSPESIEARIAATDRVLTFARSGYTGAHMALEREAAHARAELIEAKHRLLTDFLDDSARSFQGSRRVADSSLSRVLSTWMPYADAGGSDLDDFQRIHGHSPEEMRVLQQYLDHKGLPTASRRVAGEPIVDLSSNGGDTGSSASMRHRDDRENNRYTIQRIPDSTGANTQRAITNHDDTEMMSADGVHHWASRRIAAPMTSVGEGGSSLAGMGSEMMGGQGSAVSTSIPGAIAKGVWSGSTTTGQEPTPAFNPGPKAASLRLAAAEFIDAQNTRDRDELAFRAARHVAGMTGHLPRPVAEAAGQVFVAAVLAGCDCDKDKGCEDCGAESGEDCRPWCTGQAAHEDEKADRTKKGRRTAAVLTDFADELLF